MVKEADFCYEPELITPNQKMLRRGASRVFTSKPLFPTEVELYQETRSKTLDDKFSSSLDNLSFDVDQGVVEAIDELEAEGRINMNTIGKTLLTERAIGSYAALPQALQKAESA